MKFSIKQTLLLEALNVTGRCLETSSIPATNSFLFDLDGNSVTITASNVKTSLSYTTEIVSTGIKKKITIPGVRLKGLIAAMPEQFLEFTIIKNPDLTAENAMFVKIKAASGEYEMPADAGEDFPLINMTPEATFSMRKQDLAAGIDKTIFACSGERDPSNIVMLGINISFDPGNIRFTGLNGGMCSSFSFPAEVESENNFIVPAKAMALLRAIPSDDEVKISVAERCISFEVAENIVFRSRLIEGRYPDFKAVIPVTNPFEMTVERIQLLGALKRVCGFYDDKVKGVVLRVGSGKCQLQTANKFGEKANESIEVSYTGDPTVVGLNGSWITETLGRFEKEHVTFFFNGNPKYPVLISENAYCKEEKTNLVFVGRVDLSHINV